MYFIDELNGGNIYKYVSEAKLSDVKRGAADYFAAGQTFVLRVGNGATANATGLVPVDSDSRTQTAQRSRARSPSPMCAA